MDENLAKKRWHFRLCSKKVLSLQKISSMNENIESVKKYNLWLGNTIDSGFPRPLYTASINQYLGSNVVKVLTGQRRVGKSYILRQTAMHLMRQGIGGNNIVFINRELTAFSSQAPIPRCSQESCLRFCLVDTWNSVFSHCHTRNMRAFISRVLAEKVI